MRDTRNPLLAGRIDLREFGDGRTAAASRNVSNCRRSIEPSHQGVAWSKRQLVFDFLDELADLGAAAPRPARAECGSAAASRLAIIEEDLEIRVESSVTATTADEQCDISRRQSVRNFVRGLSQGGAVLQHRRSRGARPWDASDERYAHLRQS